MVAIPKPRCARTSRSQVPFQTLIGQRLEITIQQELTRMDNEWFFKWHFIGKDRPVEIESFRGKPIHYSGIAYSGSAVDVYWDTISRYRKIKVFEFFQHVEDELTKYPKHIRQKAIPEAESLINMFASSIQRRAVEKDRILRGDGVNFPMSHDLGRWEESGQSAVRSHAQRLLESYCDLDIETGGSYVMKGMMTETLTFLKSDGTGQREGVKGLVTGKKLFTFDTSLPVQPEDRFLRELPSGLVEEYIVEDPGYRTGLGGAIESHFQATVRRRNAAPAQASTIINNIQGENARVSINSVDNSQNLAISTANEAIFQQLRERLISAGLEEDDQSKIVDAIDQMEAAKGTAAFKEKYQAFITVAANHASVFGTLLAGLAMLL